MNRQLRSVFALARFCSVAALTLSATLFVGGSDRAHAQSTAGAIGAGATSTACSLGLGRVTSVVPVNGGCVSGPTGSAVQSWDVEQGKTYAVTLQNITDCASGGTAAAIEVMVKSSHTGNVCYTATKVSTGTYMFNVTMPTNACFTSPIQYCTVGCNPNTGLKARRSDGQCHQAHLRASTFDGGCSNPTKDADCGNCTSGPDSDGDGIADCIDGCPDDPDKTSPGLCGCGVSDADTDGDGVADCLDGCPTDPTKTGPGACGCGVPDVDTDGDGVPDCLDDCPTDPNKTNPGVCGCGVSDIDSDGDGVANCNDGCPNDPSGTTPGPCGCGVSALDTDGDGVPDCLDGCPTDPSKTSPGACGCGVSDADTDGDGVPDCLDGCPTDPNKTSPGACGCGVSDADTDGDGVPDCQDGCPTDPNKTSPGACGCGVSDADTDGDGVPDCIDGCPADPNKTDPGQCGCGIADTDTDGDGTADCIDGCPADPDKTTAGVCGCGVSDADSDGDGTPDCIETDREAFCFTDGDGAQSTPCPCVAPNVVPNPPAALGHGCANSFNLNGALLSATGTTFPDTIQFKINIGPNYIGFGFMAVGNAFLPQGVANSDGIWCVTRTGNGHMYRFGAHYAGTYGAAIGEWTYPNNVQTNSVSASTLQQPGTAYYQFYYRHAAPNFCNPSMANTSNGYKIIWP